MACPVPKGDDFLFFGCVLRGGGNKLLGGSAQKERAPGGCDQRMRVPRDKEREMAGPRVWTAADAGPVSAVSLPPRFYFPFRLRAAALPYFAKAGGSCQPVGVYLRLPALKNIT